MKELDSDLEEVDPLQGGGLGIRVCDAINIRVKHEFRSIKCCHIHTYHGASVNIGRYYEVAHKRMFEVRYSESCR